MNEALQTSWMATNTTFTFPSIQSPQSPQSPPSSPSSNTSNTPVHKRHQNLKSRWDNATSYLVQQTIDSTSNSISGILNPAIQKVTLREKIDSWFDQILSDHSSLDRHYHTVCHLEEMFGVLDLLHTNDRDHNDHDEEERVVTIMAVFFHDLVYDARSGTNEEDSANRYVTFETELLGFLDPNRSVGESLEDGTNTTKPRWNGLSNEVVRFILATKSHSVPSSPSSSSISNRALLRFLDADMAVLGKTPLAYDTYASLIRAEYAFVPHGTYCEKRADVLESFTSDGGKTVYQTEEMRDALEKLAVENLKREVEMLQRGVIPGTGDGDGNGGCGVAFQS